MDRIIEVKVNGSYLTKDNRYAGVQREANAKKLRIEFDEGWDGYAKKVTFWNALGTNPVARTLTADLLEDITESTRIYLCPIPGEAMTEAGDMTFIIDGWVSWDGGIRQRSVEDYLTVKPANFIEQAGQPVDPTPTQAEQLQEQIDNLIGDVQEQAVRAELAASDAAVSAQTSANKSREAATSAENAKTSETNAKVSETNAKASETQAATSAKAAATSETNTAAYEDAALRAASESRAARDAAKAAQEAAEEAAEQAQSIIVGDLATRDYVDMKVLEDIDCGTF